MKDKTENTIRAGNTYKTKDIDDWYETINIEAWSRKRCRWEYRVIEDSMEPEYKGSIHYITSDDLLRHYTLISAEQQAYSNIYDELKSILLA